MEQTTSAELRRIGRSIRAARLALGVSQESFAELAEIDRTYVSRIELGQVNVSWDSLSRVARALRLKPSALLMSAGL